MALLTACNNDDEDDSTSGFDRRVMLTDAADMLIMPAYTRLNYRMQELEADVAEFNANPNAALLQDLRQEWIDTYTDWQYANAFNFGPAGEQGLRRGLIEEIGTWPISQSKVEDAISAGTWNLNDFNRDARGFLTVEYLIFGHNTSDEALLESFQNQMRRDYLTAVVSDIKSRVEAVLDEWTGSYRAEFISSTGTSAGSSISVYYNEFVRSYEALKNFKVGLPLGMRPGQIQAEPQLVEAYYSGTSVQMMHAHLDAVENIWHGRNREGNLGTGFIDYLNSVAGGPELVAATIDQLADVRASLDAVPLTQPASEQIQNSPQALDDFHTQLQMHTRFFKSDMSSLLGITITFSSGDGD